MPLQSYEAMNRMLLSQRHGPASLDGGLTNVELALSGAAAGVVAWLSTFWADVLKTRVQASAAQPGVRGTLRAEAAAVWAEGGPRAFFRGVGPTLLRCVAPRDPKQTW
jgi:solute carrier family 25 carnitine/acylcarnitine transporter 20/29